MPVSSRLGCFIEIEVERNISGGEGRMKTSPSPSLPPKSGQAALAPS